MAFLLIPFFAGSGRADGTVAQWTLIGPQPLIYTNGTQHSGQVNALAVDPRNSSVVYLGAAGGGVWKTTDGGQTWVPLTDNQPSLQIGALALDPSNPDNVYVGTDMNNELLGNEGMGILKSTDGGASWSQLAGPVSYGPGIEAPILSLAVSPSDGNVLLAGEQSGVYRSADDGNTWNQVVAPTTTAGGIQVLFDPTNGNIAYAILDTVYKSTDGGNTWAPANGTGSNVLPTGTVICLGITPSNSSTLYAGTCPSSGPFMYKTVDGGQNWTALPSIATGCAWMVRVDPTNPNVVVGASAGVAESLDGGSSWKFVDAGFAGFHGGMEFSADGSVLYMGEEGGVWKATNVTANPWTLTDLNATLATQEFYGIAIHPTDPTKAIGGAQSNGMDIYSGALSWQSVVCDDGGDAAFDFMNPSTIYATCTPNPVIVKSTDGGGTFSSAQDGIDASEFSAGIFPALAMDPANSQRLYVAATHVWQSNNGADSWTSISGALGGSSASYEALAVAPSDSETVYLGNSLGVYVSTNATSGSGATWSNISAGLPLNLAQCNYYGPTCVYLTRVAVDFSKASTAYATFSSYVSGHIYKTTNNGTSWSDISGNLPNLKVNDIAVDPDVPNTLYIATEQGVYATADGGNTWNLPGTGLPNVAVTAVKLHRPTRILRAATFGRSVWDLHLGSVASPVGLSPTSLSFQNQGPAQTVTLTNNGTAPLTLYSVTPPSGFSQTNNCGVQIKAGGNCTITVSFVSNESGTFSGDITVSDDAPAEPQSIAVTGTGAGSSDFSLGIASGSSSSTTITAGHTGTYSLNVIPEGGFNQTVSFACSGAPSEATCSVSPGFATLDGTNPATITVSVTTTAPSSAMRSPHNGPSMWGGLRNFPLPWPWVLALIAILVVSDLRRAQRRVPFLPTLGLGLVILLAGAWVACGGSAGTGGGGTGGGNPGTPSGTYTLTVTGTHPSSTTTLTHSVSLTLKVS
jgi:photosystem II stability/assembly factor-like uncharacterized protein